MGLRAYFHAVRRFNASLRAVLLTPLAQMPVFNSFKERLAGINTASSHST